MLIYLHYFFTFLFDFLLIFIFTNWLSNFVKKDIPILVWNLTMSKERKKTWKLLIYQNSSAKIPISIDASKWNIWIKLQTSTIPKFSLCHWIIWNLSVSQSNYLIRVNWPGRGLEIYHKIKWIAYNTRVLWKYATIGYVCSTVQINIFNFCRVILVLVNNRKCVRGFSLGWFCSANNLQWFCLRNENNAEKTL